MLELKDVHFAYDSELLLKGITFKLSPGEIVSLIGSSGSGKTTLFRLITAMISPQRGSIDVEEAATTYMRQEDLLLPWRTVLENLLLIGELGRKKNALHTQALSYLEQVGLSSSAHLYPHELSGGMRQRVSLARALLQNRPLLLLDEPFGSLDVIIREELYTLLTHLSRKEGKTILLVTHDFRDALSLSDRILVLSHGTITKEFACNTPQSNEAAMLQAIRHALQS